MDVPCRTKNVNKYYRVIAEVGSGTYGKVYKAECLKSNDFVALKKIDTRDAKIVSEGFPITAIREVKLLKMMSHRNVIRLREIIISKPSHRNNYRGSTFLVFDYMDHDFAGLHRLKGSFSLPQLKCIFKQILEGVKYLHDNKIVHRDLKCANILLNNKGEVKVADFGLARTLSNAPNPRYTHKVVTLWYRAPELLLGQTNYTTQIDMWSIGCIFAELLAGDILFKGDCEYRQMEKIYELCGSINEFNWPQCIQLRNYEEFKPRRNYDRILSKHLKEMKPSLDQITIDLIEQLLILDPAQRLTALGIKQALGHDFFKVEPKGCEVSEMPALEKEFHETLLKNEQKGQNVSQQKKQWTSQQQQQQQGTSYNNDQPFQNYAIKKFATTSRNGPNPNIQKVIRDERESKIKEKMTKQVQKSLNQQNESPVGEKIQQEEQRSDEKNDNFNLEDILHETMEKEQPNDKGENDDMVGGSKMIKY